MGRIKIWAYSGKGAFRAVRPLFRAFSLSFIFVLALVPACLSQTELGSEDDLTVLGADGTVPDPDAEIKGFTVFGSTNLLTHISTAPGNVVINGALEVSSDVYVNGNVAIGTSPATARLHVQDSANQLRLGYSSDKYAAFSMDSNAILTLTPWTAGGQGIVKFASPGYFTMAFTQGKTITSTAGGITIGNGNDLVIEGNSGKLKLGKAGGGAPAEIYADQSGSTNDVLFDTVGGRLKLLIAGTERARIDLVGQMGVGTTVPAARLHISSPNAAAADTILQVSSGVSPGQELLVVKGDGNVGISSSTPMYRLVVSSGAGEAGTIMAVSTGATNLFWVAGDGAHAVKYWGDGSGLSGISGDNLGNHTATTDLSIAGFDIINASSITVAANKPGLTVSTHLLVMNGNVGIGTTGPGTKLSVRVDGNGANAVLRLSSILADWNIGNGPRLLFNGGTDDRSFGEIGSFLQDTGSGANAYMAFSTRGSEAVAERVRITSNGSVGIGTTTPRAKLHISGGDGADLFSAATIALGYAGTAEYPHFIHTRHNAGGFTGNAIDFYTGDTTAAGVFPTNAVLGMTINNGNIGIGTTVPGSKLEVVGGSITIRGSDSNLAIAGFTDAGGNYRVVISTAGNVGIGTTTPQGLLHVGAGAAPGLLVTSAGKVAIGTTTASSNLSVQGNGWNIGLFSGQSGGQTFVELFPDGSIGSTRASYLGHTANGDPDFTIVTEKAGGDIVLLPAKNVGIGTTGPLSKFDVFDGSITVRGTNAGLVLENASRVISPETDTALGAGVKVSTNVYIVGFTSATKYFGDGSSLTGITAPGDNLGNHTATAVLQMGAYGVNTSSDITAARYQINGSTMVAILPGTNSIAYGVYAGTSNITGGNYNVFIGNYAGASNTTGIGNTANGYQALYSNTTGGDNTASGRYALYSNTTGGANIATGYQALYLNTTGGSNTANGYYALRSNTTGDANTANGRAALFSNTTGINNTANGQMALRYNQTGSANSVFGFYAGGSGAADVNSFSSATIMGYQAGYNLTTGSDNTFLGWQSGYNATTGAGNIVIGYDKRTSAPGASNELNIGGVLYGDLSAKTIGISTRIPEAALDIVSTGTAQTQFAQLWRDGAGVVKGSMSATGVMMAAKFVGNGSGLTGITGDNLGNHTATAVLQMGAYGVNTSSDITAARYQINGSTVMAILPGANSIGVGKNAGRISIGSDSTFVGTNAGYNVTTGLSTFVGSGAGYTTTSGSFNSFLGYQAGYDSASSFNTFMGGYAGRFDTTGGYNAFYGYSAGRNTQTGSANAIFGTEAGYGVSGNSFSSSTIIGSQAGYNLTTGSDNTFLGWQSGYNATTGAGNIVIGYDKRTSAPGANNELNIGGVLYGDLSAKTIGISTRIPEAALDIVSTGTAQTQFAQLWRDSDGVVKGSMSATGVMMAAKFVGDGSGLSGITGDNLGNHTATAVLQMAAYGVNTSSDITAARYQINGSTVLAVLPGGSSLGIGPNAGKLNSGANNLFVGVDAGSSTLTGTRSTFLGTQAGASHTTGVSNTFVGWQAGLSTKGSPADENTFVGNQAGLNNTTGKQNTFVGNQAGENSATGIRNTFLGNQAGRMAASGSYNTFVGEESGFNNASGSANAIFGAYAGLSGNSFSSSTIMGYRAGYGLSTGSDNILLGFQAGYNVNTGTGNIVIGYDKLTSAPGANNELNIGGVLYGDLSAKTIGISTRIPEAALDIVSTGTAQTQFAQLWRDGSGVVKGSMSATGVMMAAKFVGDGSGLTGISAPGDNLGNHTATAVLQMGAYGVNTSSDITATRYQINGSTVLAVLQGSDSLGVGIGAGSLNTGAGNTFVGINAGSSSVSGTNNSFFGSQAGASNIVGGENSFFGKQAGLANKGDYNSFVGYQAGYSNTTGIYNSFFGAYAGYANTTGAYNTFVGPSAGNNTTTGIENSIFGYQAGLNSRAGSENAIFGFQAGKGSGSNSYSSSTLMGYRAGYLLTTGSNNLFLGWQAGASATTGTDNIVIGYNKDTSATGASNELNIGGVLYGDLAAKTVGISTRVPQAALDVVSTGTAQTQFAQLWRDSDGVVKGSMSATGVMMAAKFVGDGSGLTNVPASVALSGITAAAAPNTIANGANVDQIWNWSPTVDSKAALTLGETAAATGGTSTNGTPNQVLLKLDTLAGSTESPFSVYSRGSHIFSASPTTAQILAANGTAGSPTYAFADTMAKGMFNEGPNGIGFAVGGSRQFLVGAGSISAPPGTASSPGLYGNDGAYNIGLFWDDGASLGFSIAAKENLRLLAGTARYSKGSADAVSYALNARKARGTVTAPTAITTGDDLLTLSGYGYVGGTGQYVEAARIDFTSTGTITDAANGAGGVIKFETRASGGNLAEQMRIDSSGNVGIGTATPTGLFQVGGGSLTVLSSGNVGVGTTNPLAKLQIGNGDGSLRIDGPGSDTVASSDTGIYFGDTANAAIIKHRASGGLGFDTYDNTWRTNVVIDGSGNVGIGTVGPVARLEVKHSVGDIYALKVSSNNGTGMLFVSGSGTVGISTGVPQAALDVVSTGTAQTQFAQLWRDGAGVVVGSMSATGVMMAAKFVGDGSGLTGISAPGDNLGNHTATAVLQMGAYGVNTSSAITAARYQINGSTVLAILPGDGTSLGIGVNAGKLNTTGQYNVFIGYAAGTSNTTENYNSFFGNAAGSLSTGSSNSFLGAFTGYANSGSNNSFVGYWAGRFNSTGGNNSFIGTGAGGFNETGSYNSLLGYNTGISNTTGGYNSFLGAEAGYYNTTGANNSLMGYRAGYFSAAGSANSILGYEAGYGVTLNSFSSSTLVGYRAGYGLTTGSDNTFLGWQSGYNVTTGTGNVVIGYDKRTSASGASNELNIGGVLYGDLSAKTIGISTRVPQAALDIVSTGTAADQMAQIWRDGAGVVKGSMSATGVMMAAKFVGDGSGLTNVPAAGIALSGITAAAAPNTIANGANVDQIWNWSPTVDSKAALTLGETVAATGGTSTNGTPNQMLLKLGTLAGSTQSPFSVYSRGSHVFSVSPTAAQILAANGSVGAPTYSWASRTDSGMSGENNGIYTSFSVAGTQALLIGATGSGPGPGIGVKGGTAANDPTIWSLADNTSGIFFPSNNVVGITIGNMENARFLAGALQLSKGTANTLAYALNARKARGTVTAPTAITTGDDLLTLSGYGYVGGTGQYVEAARIDFTSTGTITDAANGAGGVIKFETRASGGNLAEQMRIDSSGNVGVSTGAPQARLDVLAAGSAQTDMAQLWRDSGGVIVSSVSATGVMMAAKFVGDGASLTNISSNAGVYTLAQMNALVPQAAGRLVSVSDAAAPYSYCVSTGTAAGAWVMLNQTLHCQ